MSRVSRYGIVVGIPLLMLGSRNFANPGANSGANSGANPKAARGVLAGDLTHQVPHIHQPLVPHCAAPGTARFQLTVNGAGFTPEASVQWNGGARKTTFLNQSQLVAVVTEQDVAKPSTAAVTVVEPNGATSNPAYFEVARPAAAVSFQTAVYPTGPTGGEPYGLVAGDFNRDGIPDLASIDIQSHQVAVRLGLPGGTLADEVRYQTGRFPAAIAAGDFNADGNLDLAVADSGNPSNGAPSRVTVLLGNGDGTFRPGASFTTAQGPAGIVTGDFNGDGKLDIATADYNIALGNQVSILLGNGDGTFQPHTEYTVGFGPRALVAGDFNGDGKLDLVTADQISGAVSILLGNGDGTFRRHCEYAAGDGAVALAATDFNGDGKLDLAVADVTGHSVSVLVGNGDGTFGPPVRVPTGSRSAPVAVGAGDFNADGKLDLAVVSQGTNAVSILLGNGDGTFQARQSTAAGLSPQGIAIADFNADGRPDIAVVDVFGRATEVLLQK